MAYNFSIFNEGVEAGGRLDERYVDWLVNEWSADALCHYERLWNYYVNEMRPLITDSCTVRGGAGIEAGGGDNSNIRYYYQGQECGLPSRITGMEYSFYGGVWCGRRVPGVERKEVVIENDIAWRVDTLVDFLFGQGVHISSRVEDKQRAGQIEGLLRAVFDANGGTSYFQRLGLLGSIYGFVDVIVRVGEDFGFNRAISVGGTIVTGQTEEGQAAGSAGEGLRQYHRALEKASSIILEAIEAPRSLPVLDENDYRQIRYYIQHYYQQHNELDDKPSIIKSLNSRGLVGGRVRQSHNVEITGPHYWQRYEDGELVAQGVNPLGIVPVVHILNMPVGRRYEGKSDVEPLLALQDELNTRLSDRAHRITLQSFKMYLVKGLEDADGKTVGPNRMWFTSNPDASVEEFGADSGSPSETEHINHIREALDKASGVASIAAGILKGRIGNLTSAVALKMTLMGVLAKTQRKRQSYGKGITDICRLVLEVMDKAGVFITRPDERQVDIHWPSPLPENVTEKLQEAQMKKELGVPQDVILKELGY